MKQAPQDWETLLHWSREILVDLEEHGVLSQMSSAPSVCFWCRHDYATEGPERPLSRDHSRSCQLASLVDRLKALDLGGG